MIKPMYRQGDVYFIPAAIPAGGKKRESGTAAYGEVTGHSHRLDAPSAAIAEVLECGDGLYLRVSEEGLSIGGATFVHEEHAAISLPPGDYEIRIQREYTPEGIRNVLD